MKKILPYILILLAVGLFFWKVVFRGLVPFPGDLLVGAYYPWYEYKWGFVAGVPVKNGLISDVFSQMYVWKHLVIESFKSGQWPLWNPYVYSGYPLLADFSSGVLYPLNALILWGVNGWSTMIILQVLGTGISMYWFLSQKKFGLAASVGGALAFAFSASMMGRLEWNSAGHVMWWLATLMAIVETYFQKNRKSIIVLPLLIFLAVTAGHFQTMLYSLSLVGLYVLYIVVRTKDWRRLFEISAFALLGIIMSLPQLLPTLAMMKKSVRFVEEAISKDNFGLLPPSNLITLIAPDFYGNPSTGNFWGFLNYSETIFYPGILGAVAILWSGINIKKLKPSSRFFFAIAVISLLLAFDNPVGRLIYQFNVPFLSTGYAARIAVLLMFSSSFLIAQWIEKLPIMKIKEVILPFIILGGAVIIGLTVSEYSRKVFLTDPDLMTQWLKNMDVIKRNLVWPSLLIVGLFCLTMLRKYYWVRYLVILILIADLFRFGWKYNPFVPKTFVFPDTEITDFLKSQPGLFRVESQKGALLPANSWAMFGLYSASGYDPLVNKNYAYEYSRQLNRSDSTSRYSILERYNSKDLGEFNVKYLLVEKENHHPDKKAIMTLRSAFETKKIIVYENLDFKDRIEWAGQDEGQIEVRKYSMNQILLSYSSLSDGEIIIRDGWDEGWQATVDGKETSIEIFNNVFRKVSVTAGEGIVELNYSPNEWVLGYRLAFIALFAWSIAGLYIMKQKYE